MQTSRPSWIAQAGLGLFASTIFSAAFLIFAVQPMVGKHILPWFGGVPAVWMTCLAFYQSALFAGYVYAYWLIARVASAHQPWVHAGLFLAALVALPILPGADWRPEGSGDASFLILMMLSANVALPFVLLASTGPLVQAWFSKVFPEQSPYGLYAVGNLGSLLALLSYPFFVEPQLALSAQSWLWTLCFAACGVGVLGCAGWAARSSSVEPEVPKAHELPDGSGAPARSRIGLWVLLPAGAVVLMMGVTNQLCLDVASIPFLWIVPLSVYLLTLVFCFASERLYPRLSCMGLALLSLAILIGPADWKTGPELWQVLEASMALQVLLYALALFFACMIAHGELYRLRPDSASLTTFYLCVAGGGALGGLFVGIAAPRIFSAYYELPIGVVMCWSLAAVALWLDPPSVWRASMARLSGAAVIALSAALCLVALSRAMQPELGTRALSRGFYGILRVVEGGHVENDPWMKLRSGSTNHGLQFMRPGLRRQPTSYYGVMTGIGLVLNRDDAEVASWQIGVIGLGVGTLAAYGNPGDRMVFYEVDPEVVRIAQQAEFFSFLQDSRAEIEIVVGDARLSLESELQRDGGREFDVLVVDAFTSDAIPVHLLTRQAIELYRQQLKTGGVLAIHISNRHLSLAPLVFRLVEETGMHGVVIENKAVPSRRSEIARWVVFSDTRDYIDGLSSLANQRGLLSSGEAVLAAGRPSPERVASAPVWTDDYSNLFGVLRRGR